MWYWRVPFYLFCVNLAVEVFGENGCAYKGIRQECIDDIPSNVRNTSGLYLDFYNTTRVTFPDDFQNKVDGYNLDGLQITCHNNSETTIHVNADGFSMFPKMRYLYLKCANIILDKEAFNGLARLRLVLIDSINLCNKQLLSSLSKETLPSLRIIKLRNSGINRTTGFDLGTLNNAFRGVKIRVLLKGMKISKVTLEDFRLQTYPHFIIVDSTISTVDIKTTLIHERLSLGIDISKTTEIKTLQFLCPKYDVFYLNPDVPYFSFTLVNISNINVSCASSFPDILRISNLQFVKGFQFHPGTNSTISDLSMDNCNLFNVTDELFTKNMSLARLSLANNNMYFIGPNTFLRTASLISLDLSFNRLQIMNTRYPNVFEGLFVSLVKLQEITLRGNGIHNIPPYMFINNKNLKAIDLSLNSISQLTFLTIGLNSLRYLDVHTNQVSYINRLVLDRFDVLCENINTSDITTFNSAQYDQFVSTRRKTNLNQTTTFKSGIILTINPINCSSCEANNLITWIQNNKDCVTNCEITCLDKDGKPENIFLKGLLECPEDINPVQIPQQGSKVYDLVIYLGTVIFLVLFGILIARCIIKRKQVGKKDQFGLPMNELPKNDETKPPCKYFVFIAYSSLDEEFINTKVITELTRGLQARIKDDVKPLCLGDFQFKIGFSLHDEIIACIAQSKAVLILLTDNFCRSECCVTEFNMAMQLNKPVIVMVKGKLDEKLMTEGLKLRYKTNTRIIWSLENGEYVLKNSWKNICDSFINLDRK